VNATAIRPPAARVLVIDDDRELCALMTEFLASHGYQVSTASDGAEGLEAALGERPDVVILDVMMPRLNRHACRS